MYFINTIFISKLLTTRGEWDRANKNGQLMVNCKQQFAINCRDEDKYDQKLEYCRCIISLLDKFHSGCSYERGNEMFYQALLIANKKIDVLI